jgi:transposase
LTARKLVQGKRHDMEMSLRGILRGFGLKIGPTPRSFESRTRELVDEHEILVTIADALLLARANLAGQSGRRNEFLDRMHVLLPAAGAS